MRSISALKLGAKPSLVLAQKSPADGKSMSPRQRATRASKGHHRQVSDQCEALVELVHGGSPGRVDGRRPEGQSGGRSWVRHCWDVGELQSRLASSVSCPAPPASTPRRSSGQASRLAALGWGSHIETWILKPRTAIERGQNPQAGSSCKNR